MPKQSTLKEILENAVKEMVERGILWNEAQAQFEKLFILNALRHNRGNLGRAAVTLGVHRNTLTRKLREHRIQKETIRALRREGAEKAP